MNKQNTPLNIQPERNYGTVKSLKNNGSSVRTDYFSLYKEILTSMLKFLLDYKYSCTNTSEFSNKETYYNFYIEWYFEME